MYVITNVLHTFNYGLNKQHGQLGTKHSCGNLFTSLEVYIYIYTYIHTLKKNCHKANFFRGIFMILMVRLFQNEQIQLSGVQT